MRVQRVRLATPGAAGAVAHAREQVAQARFEVGQLPQIGVLGGTLNAPGPGLREANVGASVSATASILRALRCVCR